MLVDSSNHQNRLSTLERAILALQLLASSKKTLSLTEIASNLNLPAGTAHIILKTLEKHNLIQRTNGTKNYTLGFKLFQLGNNVSFIRELREAALPFMRELTKDTGQTSNLAILSNESLYFLEIVESPTATKTRSSVGLKIPLHATAAGKALLAFQSKADQQQLLQKIELVKFTPNTITQINLFQTELDKIRNLGVSIDNEEIFLGTRCIAAPIFNESNSVCAALGITGEASFIADDQLAVFIKTVQHEALNISLKLGCCK